MKQRLCVDSIGSVRNISISIIIWLSATGKYRALLSVSQRKIEFHSFYL